MSKLKKLIIWTTSAMLVLNVSFLTGLIKPEKAKAAEADVKINEVLPNPDGLESEKVELYNNSSESVDLSEWKINDSSDTIFTITNSISIAPNDFYVANLPGSHLNNGGDTVTLENSTGSIIDRVTYPNLSTPDGISYARKPDGVGNFFKDPSPTIGSSNGEIPTPSSIVTSNFLNKTSDNFTATATIPTNEGISSIELFLDSNPFIPAMMGDISDESVSFDAGLSSNIDLQSLISEGVHRLSARAVLEDTMGGISESLTFTADYTSPSSTVTTSGILGPNSWPGEINGTASDNLSGITSVSFTLTNPSGKYWNGTDWQDDSATLTAFDTTSWYYSIDDSNFGQEEIYTVTPQATDAAGNLEATGISSTFTWDATPPENPSLSVKTGNGFVDLSWNEVPGAVEYQIWRAASPFPDNPLAITKETSYKDTSVVNGKTYHYIVVAIDEAGNTSIDLSTLDTSNAISAKPFAPITFVPQAQAEEIVPPAAAQITPPAATEEGKILGGQEENGGATNWTPLIVLAAFVVLFVAGYFGWKWFANRTPTDRW